MDKTAKEKLIQEIKDVVVGKQGVYLTEYQGMTVEQTYNLRREFDKAEIGYKVVKNTLARLAFKGTEYDFLAKDLKGPMALAYANDPIAPAKVLVTALKAYDKLKFKAAFLTGARVDASQLDALSKLPGKDEMRARLLGLLQTPAQQMVSVLAAAPRQILNVLKAREQSLSGN